jgi:hypothetical protein
MPATSAAISRRPPYARFPKSDADVGSDPRRRGRERRYIGRVEKIIGTGHEGKGTVVEGFAVQIGFPEILLGLAILALVGVGIWKLAKVIGTAISG